MNTVKSTLRLISLIFAISVIVTLLLACLISCNKGDNPDNSYIQNSDEIKVISVNPSDASGNQTIKNWLETCEDEKHSMIKNYILIYNNDTDNGTEYCVYIYRTQLDTYVSAKCSLKEFGNVITLSADYKNSGNRDNGKSLICVTFTTTAEIISPELYDDGDIVLGTLTQNAKDNIMPDTWLK